MPRDCDGCITYDLTEFSDEYGDPLNQLFTFEVICDATRYTYANVAGEVRGAQVVFDLSRDDLIGAHRLH